MKTDTQKTLEEYNRIQAIRAWNVKSRTPEVCTALWKNEDFQGWIDSRNPLPPFDEWIKE